MKVEIQSDAKMQVARIAKRIKGGYFERGELFMMAEILEDVSESIKEIGECDWCGNSHPNDRLMNETQAGDAICDICAHRKQD